MSPGVSKKRKAKGELEAKRKTRKVECACSSSEDLSDVQEIIDKVKASEDEQVKDVLVIEKDKALAVLKLLNGEKVLKKTRADRMRDACKYKDDLKDEINWDSPMYIVRCIRNCILKKDWATVTSLLRLLMRHSKKFTSYIKEMSFMNVLHQSGNVDGAVLEEFYQFCFTKLPSNYVTKEFDMWFCDNPDSDDDLEKQDENDE